MADDGDPAAIRARLEHYRALAAAGTSTAYAQDVPVLLALVDRLTAESERLRDSAECARRVTRLEEAKADALRAQVEASQDVATLDMLQRKADQWDRHVCPVHIDEGLPLVREVKALRAQVEAVRALHAPRGVTCLHCHRMWPCPTLRALDGTETDP